MKKNLLMFCVAIGLMSSVASAQTKLVGAEAQDLYGRLTSFTEVEHNGVLTKSGNVLVISQFLERWNPRTESYYRFASAFLDQGVCADANLSYANSGSLEDHAASRDLFNLLTPHVHTGGGETGENIYSSSVNVICEKAGPEVADYSCELERAAHTSTTVVGCVKVSSNAVSGILYGQRYSARPK